MLIVSPSTRTTVLRVRLTAEERMSFLSASQACSASLSAWVRYAMAEQIGRDAEERGR